MEHVGPRLEGHRREGVVIGLHGVVAAACEADTLRLEAALEGSTVHVLLAGAHTRAGVAARPIQTVGVVLAKALLELDVADAAVDTIVVDPTAHAALEPKWLRADLLHRAVAVLRAPLLLALAYLRIAHSILRTIVGIDPAARRTDVAIVKRTHEAELVVEAVSISIAGGGQTGLRPLSLKEDHLAHLPLPAVVVSATAGPALADLQLAVLAIRTVLIHGAALDAVPSIQVAIAVLGAIAGATTKGAARLFVVHRAVLRWRAVAVLVARGLHAQVFELAVDLAFNALLADLTVPVLAAADAAGVHRAPAVGEAVRVLAAPLDALAGLQRAGEAQRAVQLAAAILASGLRQRAIAVLGASTVRVP